MSISLIIATLSNTISIFLLFSFSIVILLLFSRILAIPTFVSIWLFEALSKRKQSKPLISLCLPQKDLPLIFLYLFGALCTLCITDYFITFNKRYLPNLFENLINKNLVQFETAPILIFSFIALLFISHFWGEKTDDTFFEKVEKAGLPKFLLKFIKTNIT